MTAPPADSLSPVSPPRYADYCRVSGDLQKEKQISVPQQHRECRQHVLSRAGLLVREFHDLGVSGETLERPGLQALLAHARAGADPQAGATVLKKEVTRNAYLDALVVWKLDRLSRPDEDDDLDFLTIRRDLRRCGVRIESVTEPWVAGATDMDGFMGYLGRGQTKLEKATRERRFRLGRQGIAEMGRQVGPPPYGYDWLDPDASAPLSWVERRKGRPWAPVEPMASWVVRIYDWYLAGCTVSEVCRRLNAAAVPPPSRSGHGGVRGGALRHDAAGWTTKTVWRILRNRRYAGYIQFEGAWISTAGTPQGHPPLIADGTWLAAQAVHEGRGPRRAAAALSLFAGGLLRCPRCAALGADQAMVAVNHVSRTALVGGGVNAHRYAAYICGDTAQVYHRGAVGIARARRCAGFGINEGKLLTILTAYLTRYARRLGPGEGRVALAQRPAPPPRRDGGDALRREMARELDGLPAMRDNYREQQARGLMGDGPAGMDALEATLARLGAREAALRAALAALEAEKPGEEVDPLRAAQLLRLLSDPEATPIQKRDGLNAVFESIVPGLDRRSVTVRLRRG